MVLDKSLYKERFKKSPFYKEWCKSFYNEENKHVVSDALDEVIDNLCDYEQNSVYLLSPRSTYILRHELGITASGEEEKIDAIALKMGMKKSDAESFERRGFSSLLYNMLLFLRARQEEKNQEKDIKEVPKKEEKIVVEPKEKKVEKVVLENETTKIDVSKLPKIEGLCKELDDIIDKMKQEKNRLIKEYNGLVEEKKQMELKSKELDEEITTVLQEFKELNKKYKI